MRNIRVTEFWKYTTTTTTTSDGGSDVSAAGKTKHEGRSSIVLGIPEVAPRIALDDEHVCHSRNAIFCVPEVAPRTDVSCVTLCGFVVRTNAL